jgi:hypothetical protein
MSDKKEEEQLQQQHIQTEPQDDEQEEKKGSGGLLSTIGDPIGRSSAPPTCHSPPSPYLTCVKGNVLGTALRPVGAPLEKGLTGPLGNALGGTTRPALGPLLGHEDEKSELLGGNNKDSYESRPEKIAGKEQTGQNPLGLDQTGRWGFEDEKK